jgi:hypothetical protein
MAQTRRADAVTTTSSLLVGVYAVLLLLLGCGKPAADDLRASKARAQVGFAQSTEKAESGGEARPSSVTTAPRTSVGSPEPSAIPAPVQTTDPQLQQRDPPSSPTDEAEPKARPVAEQAQWQAWFAAARDSPDVGLRLHALEQWAQRPGEAVDPVTYGLVDEDESVRARAQELYQKQLTRDAAEAVPVQQEEQPVPAVER